MITDLGIGDHLRNRRGLAAISAAFGSVFSLLLLPLWDFEPRWLYISVVSLVFVAILCLFIARLSDFLLIALIASVPIAGFAKLVISDEISEVSTTFAPVSGAILFGVTDILLIGLYLSWFWRVFALRIPASKFSLGFIDWLVLAIGAGYIGSITYTIDAFLGLSAFEHYLKHSLVYFYVSRHFRSRHLPWLLGCIYLSLILESGLGLFQYHSGTLVGLMHDKGSAGDKLNMQYEVYGIEDLTRATGTSYDSHTFGLYIAMMLPFPLTVLFTSSFKWAYRIVCGFLIVPAGLQAMAMTYSRSALLSCFISLLVMIILLVRLREKQTAPILILLFIAGVFAVSALPDSAVQQAIDRFATAPSEIITARIEQYSVATAIWLEHPIFGIGAGNYQEAIRSMNENWALEQTVHNVFLFILAELGIFGVCGYYSLFFAGLILSYMRTFRSRTVIESRVALAIFTAMIVYQLDGITDPLFREPIVYLLFWIVLGVIVSFGIDHGLLHRGRRGSPSAPRQAGDLQHGSGLPVHQHGVRRTAPRPRHPGQHGRQRPLGR